VNVVQWPARLSGSQNAREHHHARARRVKAERGNALLMCRTKLRQPALWPVVIRLTRIGPRKLDSDNVQGSLKAVRDGVADWLGLDDGDERITWLYAQERGAYAVRVEVVPGEDLATWDEVLP